MGTVTIGANDYEIYGTVAEADIYLAAKIGQTEWTAASADTKAQALVTGTRLIRQYLALQGYDLDPASAVDVEIEQANYELSYALVVSPSLQSQANTNAAGNKKRVKAGSAEVEYFRPESGARFPSQVQVLLTSWISGQGGAFTSAGLNSGDCERSTLCPGDYRLSEGY